MAPYVIAHLKLGWLLQETGYDLGARRLGIYLTNALENPELTRSPSMKWVEDTIAEEANAASEVKRHKPIMVVLGNPPYSGISANRSWEVKDGKEVRTFIGDLIDDYYFVDDQPLGEKKVWLQDDYVKFIRWGQWRIARTGAGILALITNHAYLDNPTFRGMRQQLMKGFDEIYLLDLHGNARKKESCPDGSKDENVFDIQQGVVISLFVKLPGSTKNGRTARVYHNQLWGLRETEDKKGGKYVWLGSNDVSSTPWTQLTPSSPYYFFVPRLERYREDYESWWKITDIYPLNVAGIVTARDHFVIDFDREALLERIGEFKNEEFSDENIREKYFRGRGSSKYPHGDTRGWKLPEARKRVQDDQDWKSRVRALLYRPLDERFVYYVEWMVDWPRPEVMRHMLAGKNLALLFHRREELDLPYSHFLVTRWMTEHGLLSSKTTNYQAPLYVYPLKEIDRVAERKREPNLNPKFVTEIESRLGLSFVSDGSGDLKETIGPEGIFNYIYAVFHSPTYRSRYAEFLKMDFPRVPLTSNLNLFKGLVKRGTELVSLHLMESPALKNLITKYPAAGSNIVEKVTYNDVSQRVHINKDQYFEGIPPEMWEFRIGGYQVCEKWLKSRKGRTLSYNDLTHYQKIIVAIKETIRLMAEIDGLIPSWPIK